MINPEPLQLVGRTHVRFRGRKLSFFAGCDYFRLSSDPQVLAALRAGLEKYGLNVAASRKTTGNHALYAKLERGLARFFGSDAALLVATGYVADTAVAQALAGNFSHVLIDARAHPALVDAARVFDCPVLTFKHRDVADAAAAARRCGSGASIILLTDGMFSHDGSVAPLAGYLAALPADAMILVDDAHGAGVLGKTGKGSLEEAGVARRRIIQTISLSKAFGVYGGAVLGTANLCARIVEKSRLFVGSTPLPLPLAVAALTSLKLVKPGAGARRRLRQNADLVKTAARQAGLPVPQHPGPILQLIPRSEAAANRFKRALLANGIHPPFTRYVNGPTGGYFRFVISSEHSPAQLERLVQVIRADAPNSESSV